MLILTDNLPGHEKSYLKAGSIESREYWKEIPKQDP